MQTGEGYDSIDYRLSSIDCRSLDKLRQGLKRGVRGGLGILLSIKITLSYI